MNFFHFVAILGFLLTWGLFTLNGGTTALFKTAWDGIFPDSTTLMRQKWVYLPGLDFLLKFTTARFIPGFTWFKIVSWNSPRDYSHVRTLGESPESALCWFFFDYAASIQVISMIILLEGSRGLKRISEKNLLNFVGRPAIWITLSTLLSSSTVYSLWFTSHLSTISAAATNTPGFFDIGYNHAIGLLISHFLSTFVPMVLLVSTSGSLRYEGLIQWQMQVAWWVFAGITGRIGQHVFAWFVRTETTRSDSRQVIKLCYTYVFLVAAGAHWWTLFAVWKEPTLSLGQVFVPRVGVWEEGFAGALLAFWQWEAVVAFAAALVWASLAMQVRRGQSVPGVKVTFGGLWRTVKLGALAAAISPGAVLATLMWQRDRRLFWV